LIVSTTLTCIQISNLVQIKFLINSDYLLVVGFSRKTKSSWAFWLMKNYLRN
jgi:hypothetical protein